MADDVEVDEVKRAMFCATVTTGLEGVAVSECRENLGCENVRKDRGKVYFMLDSARVRDLPSLRSVEHLFVVVKEFPEFEFGDKEVALERIGNIVDDLEWALAFSVWAKYSGFHGRLRSEPAKELESVEPEAKKGRGQLPSFRVTCSRSGSGHCFSSMEAAAMFGGRVNRAFGWRVDLTSWDMEVLLNIADKRVIVGIALTKGTLGKRNLSHFGPTTLKSTLAYCMLKLADIKPGAVYPLPFPSPFPLPLSSPPLPSCSPTLPSPLSFPPLFPVLPCRNLQFLSQAM